MELLVEDLGIQHGKGWTFISDRQKGLVQVLEHFFPEGEHRFCVRHMYNNFNKKYKGEALRAEVWAAAKSTSVGAFITVMDRIKALDVVAYEWLMNKRLQE